MRLLLRTQNVLPCATRAVASAITIFKGYYFMKKPAFPKIGLRNIKTAISATLCALLYALIGRNPTFACIGAVFGMDNSLPSSLRTGGNRLAGTVIGGFLGMGFFALGQVFPAGGVTHILLLFVGIVLLMLFAPLLAEAALKFGPAEYCSLMLLGLMAASTVGRGSPIRSTCSAVR